MSVKPPRTLKFMAARTGLHHHRRLPPNIPPWATAWATSARPRAGTGAGSRPGWSAARALAQRMAAVRASYRAGGGGPPSDGDWDGPEDPSRGVLSRSGVACGLPAPPVR
jgi:hypothetical protein